MVKLVKYLKVFTPQILLIFGLVFIQVMADLQLPYYMSQIVDDGILKGDHEVILRIGIIMLIVALVSGASTIAVVYFSAKVGAGFSKNLRNEIFEKVESFSLVEINKFSTASLITRSTNDIQQLQIVLIMALRIILAGPLTAIGAAIKAAETNPSMTWIMLTAIVVLIVAVVTVFTISLPKVKMLQKLVDNLNLVTRERLTGIRVIRALNREHTEQDKFDKANAELSNVNLFVNRTIAFMHPAMMLNMNITSIAVIWVGSHMISTGDIMIGDMIAFMQYSMQLIMAFLMLAVVFIMIPRAVVSANRISEVLETDVSIKDSEDAIEISDSNFKGSIEFRNVGFTYPDSEEPVLKDITFIANVGETTAFIGSTGSGKTTLINLLMRFYDTTKGKILIDGYDIRKFKQSSLREKIGYVPQKAVLFSGTIKSNIKYGSVDALDEEISQASEVAQAREFVDDFDEKFDTKIAQNGSNVSGGQKQRLSIARAIVKKAKIYIFDDSFSALDYKTDSMLRKELSERMKEETVLIVAQRVSTIVKADKIIVLEEGEIVGVGTHNELLRNCKIYEEIALSQMSEEELA